MKPEDKIKNEIFQELERTIRELKQEYDPEYVEHVTEELRTGVA